MHTAHTYTHTLATVNIKYQTWLWPMLVWLCKFSFYYLKIKKNCFTNEMEEKVHELFDGREQTTKVLEWNNNITENFNKTWSKKEEASVCLTILLLYNFKCFVIWYKSFFFIHSLSPSLSLCVCVLFLRTIGKGGTLFDFLLKENPTAFIQAEPGRGESSRVELTWVKLSRMLNRPKTTTKRITIFFLFHKNGVSEWARVLLFFLSLKFCMLFRFSLFGDTFPFQ